MKKEDVRTSDPDMAGSAEALKRAALRARRDAERTHTPLVTYENGTIKRQMVAREKPDDSSVDGE
jgi:hypothetical protein